MVELSRFVPLLFISILFCSLFVLPVRADPTVTSGKLDFGSDGSAVQSGWTALGSTNGYSTVLGYGWVNNADSPINLSAVDRGSGSGGALDDLEQDIHYTGLERWFKVHTGSGTFNWILYYGDNGYAHGPFNIKDDQGDEVDGLSSLSSTWYHYHGSTTADANGFIHIKIDGPTNNPSFNGFEWVSAIVTTTSYQNSVVSETTVVTATSTVTLGTSLVTSTKTGGTSTVTMVCSTTDGTVSVIISRVLTSTVSKLVSVTDPAAGTLTGFETTCVTATSIYSSTKTDTSVISSTSTEFTSFTETESTSETICETLATTTTISGGTITTTVVSIKTITGYVTSTVSTPVDTVTVSGTSTLTDATKTVTEYTSTSKVGVIGGGCEMCIPLLMLVLILFVGYVIVRRRR